MTDKMGFIASLHKTEIKADGSIRIQLELGSDALDVIQKMERMRRGSQNLFTFAVLHTPAGKFNQKEPEIDEETGEIQF